MRRWIALAVVLLMCLLLPLRTVAQAPRLLFTDIVTGANTGGENNNGVYLTIYGKGFGASQGTSTITIGGGAPAQVKTWGQNNSITTLQDMIVVQVGSNVATGNIVVTVNGQASNPLPFTVCTGNIYFVAPTGSDSNAGSFTAPWATPAHARASMKAGDTVYFRAGIYNTVDDFGATILLIGSSGTPTAYQNFLGYPGEVAQIGDSSVSRAIYFWGNTVLQYVAIGELKIRSNTSTVSIQNTTGGAAANFIREVGNDATTSGSGEGIDFEMPANSVVVYGNESANNCPTACNYDNRAYSVYFGGYGAQTNIDIGWNRLHDNLFGKGIQIYGHTSVDTIQGLIIHDNDIYNNAMVGINLGGCDGGCTEFVRDARVYNNLFVNNENSISTGHKQFGDLEVYSQESVLGTVLIYNNTFYKTAPSGPGFQAGAPITFANTGPHSVALTNNIFYAADGAPCYLYFDDSTAPFSKNVTLSNNLYFNIGTGPTGCKYGTGAIAVNPDAAGVNADPKLLAPPNDLHLTATSPAIGAGGSTTSQFDFDAVLRPAPPSIGAYEPVSVTPPPLSVSCTPASILVNTGSSQCMASQPVTWSVNVGTITAAGVFSSTTVGPSTITGTAGAATATTIVQVMASIPPPTVSLTLSPTTISPGGSATLTLTSTNATSCTGRISGTSGSVTVSPGATTTYNQSCTGPGGTASASATLMVTPETATFNPSAYPLILGRSTTVTFLLTGEVTKTCTASLRVTAAGAVTVSALSCH